MELFLVLYLTGFMLLTRNQILTPNLLKQCHRYHKIRKSFSKSYQSHFDLVSKFEYFLKQQIVKK